MGQPESPSGEGRPGDRRKRQVRIASASAIQSSRARLRIALFVCLAAAGVLSFLIFPPKHVSVEADGSQKTIVSRSTDLDSILKMAGISREANDVVVKENGALRIERAIPVTIEVDGKLLSWRTRSLTVQGLLDEVGVEVSPYDGITYNGVEVGVKEQLYPGPLAALPSASLVAFAQGGAVAAGATGVSLSISRAVPFTIVEDGQPISFKSARPTIAMALRDAGIRLGPADDVFPALTSELVAGQQVIVDHAAAVTIRTGASSRVVYTHQKLLKDALAENGLALGPEDRVEPGLDTQVLNGMTARLVRVVGKSLIEREDVARKTVFRPDEGLQGTQTRDRPGPQRRAPDRIPHRHRGRCRDRAQAAEGLVRARGRGHGHLLRGFQRPRDRPSARQLPGPEDRPHVRHLVQRRQLRPSRDRPALRHHGLRRAGDQGHRGGGPERDSAGDAACTSPVTASRSPAIPVAASLGI